MSKKDAIVKTVAETAVSSIRMLLLHQELTLPALCVRPPELGSAGASPGVRVQEVEPQGSGMVPVAKVIQVGTFERGATECSSSRTPHHTSEQLSPKIACGEIGCTAVK
ncbi:protein of unknown function (plasmid) [Caballeronia sp. S22]